MVHMPEIDVHEAIRRLRADPTDQTTLDALLTLLEQQLAAQYRRGELYTVPVDGVGLVTKELATVGETRCHVRCAGLGCPGLLRFRDGTEVCPHMTRVQPAVAIDPFVLPLKLIQRLLYRGVQRGSVELFDGRVVTFNIRAGKAKDLRGAG